MFFTWLAPETLDGEEITGGFDIYFMLEKHDDGSYASVPSQLFSQSRFPNGTTKEQRTERCAKLLRSWDDLVEKNAHQVYRESTLPDDKNIYVIMMISMIGENRCNMALTITGTPKIADFNAAMSHLKAQVEKIIKMDLEKE